MSDFSWKHVVATMYDPSRGGINGSPNGGACGVAIKRITWGMAHKTLPCGTVVLIKPSNKNSPILAVPVVDRGPYSIPGVHRGANDVDLLPAVATALGLPGKGDTDIDDTQGAVISVSKFANAGGNAAAFEKVSGYKSQQGKTDPNNPSSAAKPSGPDDSFGAPADAGAAVTGVVKDTVNGIGDFISWITDPSTWLRIGKGALGATFIVVGTGALVYVVGNKAKGTAIGQGVAAATK